MKLLDVLYRELTGINQYFVHAKMRRNWGDAALYEVNSKESIGEMNHADHTIDRILFLEG
ncbi:MAG TPA: ferritin-like domain-containing protein, partial [Candidatus Binatia bacterium]|nr:ferritin-like domain-containing protein [Candidatus Binatia bacterium]